RLLNLLKAQGIEVHKTTTEIRMPAPPPAATPKASEADGAKPEGDAPRARREPPAPKEIVYPAGSYVVRMDQPYSRMADMMLDTQYYNVSDPRPYDDTGWTLGALRNVKTVRVTDKAVLQTPMTLLTRDARVMGSVSSTAAPIA